VSQQAHFNTAQSQLQPTGHQKTEVPDHMPKAEHWDIRLTYKQKTNYKTQSKDMFKCSTLFPDKNE